MEPKIPVQPNQINKNPAPDMNSTVSDLHNEGVDIVDQGTSEQQEETPSAETSGGTERNSPSENEDLELEAEIAESEKSSATESLEQPKPTPVAAPEVPRPVPPQAVQQMPTSIPVPKPPQQTPVIAAQKQAAARSSAQDEINQVLGASYTTDGKVIAPSVQNDPSIKPLRTFKSDAEEAVRYQNISASQIALAEQKKKETSTPIQYEEGKKSSVGIIAFLLIILLIGGGGAYYWFFVLKQNPASSLPQALRVETIIPYAKANTLEIAPEGNAMETVAGAIRATEIDPKSVYALIPVPTGTTTAIATVSSLFKGTQIPSMLERSLATNYMIGAYANEAKEPFIILKNTYFQNAFAGMLEWEKDLRNDLIPLIRVSKPGETITLVNSDTFEDIVISNVDARILKNSAGEVILAYAFADKDTAVITTQTETLKILLDKLLAVRVVQ